MNWLKFLGRQGKAYLDLAQHPTTRHELEEIRRVNQTPRSIRLVSPTTVHRRVENCK